MNDNFDLALIYMVRNLTKNFIEWHKDVSINGLPIDMACVAEEDPKARTLQ